MGALVGRLLSRHISTACVASRVCVQHTLWISGIWPATIEACASPSLFIGEGFG